MDTNAAFTRSLLKSVHGDVAQFMSSRPGFNRWMAARHSHKIKAASVTCSTLAGRKHYFVEISPGVAGQNGDAPRFTWEGRAHDAYEARANAWAAWLAKQQPETLD